MKERIVSFPWMGEENTLQMKRTLEELGIKVILPPPISEKTIKFGVRHSADMMCFPYKVCLGNFIEALELGANTLLMYDNCGQCRQRHYWKMQEFTLRKLGYNLELYPVARHNLLSLLRKLSGKSYWKVFQVYRRFANDMQELNSKKYSWDYSKPNIGIIGEIYTCCEEKVNYDIERKLKKMDVNPFNTASLSEFMKNDVNINPLAIIRKLFRNPSEEIFDEGRMDPEKQQYKEQAKDFLNGPVGGHGLENIYNLLWMRERTVDGIIHLLPLSCMPETTVEHIINHICQEGNIPLLRLPIDDTNSEANVDTRIETFVELIKRRRKQNEVLARG